MIESKYKIERTGEISMCWNNNKQSIIASIMIFSSLMIFTIFNESTYASTAFTVSIDATGNVTVFVGTKEEIYPELKVSGVVATSATSNHVQ